MRLSDRTFLMRAASAMIVVSAMGLGSFQTARIASTAYVSSARAIGVAPSIPRGTIRAGSAPGSTDLQFDIVLMPTSAALLQNLATAISMPGSEQYHRFLTTSRFRSEFGQSPSAIAEVTGWLRLRGLDPGPVSANGLVIPVSATVAKASNALHTQFELYRLASGRIAIANTSAPDLPASIARITQAIVGLNTLPSSNPVPQRVIRSGSATQIAAKNTVGPQACKTAEKKATDTGSWTYTQLASAYGLDGLYSEGDTGKGMTIALFEMEPWSESDEKAFQKCYDTDVSITSKPVDGGDGSGAGLEATLDIDTVIALAPKSSLLVYDAPSSNYAKSTVDEYTKIFDNDKVKVVSTSYGICESIVESMSPGLASSENTLFQQAATEGMSVFVAAGDTGSEACYQADTSQEQLAVQDPASQPFVTSVGGTDLTSVDPSEQTVWNDTLGAGGGGISSNWTMPSYQVNAPASLDVINSYSSGSPCSAPTGEYCREVPDVSASASDLNPYEIYLSGWEGGVYGTSAAAPLWAAMLVDVDQYLGGSGQGLINPALYDNAATALTNVDSDTAAGLSSNDYTGTSGLYPVSPGYSMATGLGSPVATAFAAVLKGTVVFDAAPGTGAPPATLGPYTMTAFGTATNGSTVSSIKSPLGKLAFKPSVEALEVGDDWNTWSNGYSGIVFFRDGATVTLTLPPKTGAFYFYAEPNEYETFDMEAVAANGTSSGDVTVFGEAGAEYFGFYTTNHSSIASIRISDGDPDGFAVGEFGIAKT